MKEKNSLKDEKKYIGVLVKDETKQNWVNFAENHNYSTLSKLIREAVNFYITSQTTISYFKDLSRLKYNLKEPLTSIKGFSQIFLEKYSNKLDLDGLFSFKNIVNQIEFLEKKINEFISELNQEIEEYDILIIDDDIPTTIVLTELFELKNKTSKVAINGSKGLELIKKSKPKVILLDINLPDINGYEICKKIKFDKEYKKYREIPVYYLSVLQESIVKKHLDETGANGFFLKPFNFTEFEDIFHYLDNY